MTNENDVPLPPAFDVLSRLQKYLIDIRYACVNGMCDDAIDVVDDAGADLPSIESAVREMLAENERLKNWIKMHGHHSQHCIQEARKVWDFDDEDAACICGLDKILETP